MKFEYKNILSVIVGAILGFVYNYYIGCDTGCLIQSDWKISTLYGAFAGFAFALPVKKSNKDNTPE